MVAVLAVSCGLDLGGTGPAEGPPPDDAGLPEADATSPLDAPPDDAAAEAEAAPPNDSGCGDTSSDPRNCGQCKHDCLGGTCTAGKCDPVNLATISGARYLAVAGTYVYVTGDTGSGGVYEVPKSGVPDAGAARALGTGFAHPHRLAVSGGYVYFGEDDPSGHVYRCVIAGSGCDTLVDNNGKVDGIAVDTTSFYYADVGADTIGSCTLTCPSHNDTDLGANASLPSGVAIGGGLVVFADRGTGPMYADGRILHCPLAGCGGNPSVVSTNELGPMFVVLQGGVAYWAGVGTNMKNTAQIKSCAAVGCVTPTILIDSQPTIGDLALDAKNIYWSTYGGASDGIYTCPLTGCAGTPKLVASDSDPRGLAVDDTAIYWANSEGNLVRKVAK